MFLYWVPGTEAVSYKRLVELGLGYAFEDGQIIQGRNNSGPDGGPGIVNARTGSVLADQCGYYPNKQEWRKIPKSKCWIGWEPDREVEPTMELARGTLLDSKQVKLEDGRFWAVPIARRWRQVEDSRFCVPNVPRKARYNDDGDWVNGDVKERYRPLWELVEQYQSAFEEALAASESSEGTRVQFEFPADELAIEALKGNYRISHVEADVLGIYSAEVQDTIVDVVLDADGVAEILKKKEQSATSTS